MDCIKLLIFDPDTGQPTSIDLDQGANFILNYSVTDLNILLGEDSNSEVFSYSINIPYELNKERLGFVVDHNSKQGKKFRGESNRAVMQKGNASLDGRIYYRGWNQNERGTEFVLATFVSGLSQWVDLMPRKISDLNLGEFRNTVANITASYTDGPYISGGPSYNWGLINFGGFRDHVAEILAGVDIPAMDPKCWELQVYHKAILEAMEDASGIPIKSNFFETEWFRRQVTTMGNKCRWYYTGYIGTVEPGDTINVNLVLEAIGLNGGSSQNLTPYNPYEFGFAPTVIPSSDGIIIRESGEYTFKFVVEVSNFVSPGAVVLSYEIGTAVIENIGVIEITGNGTYETEFTETLSIGWLVALRAGGNYDIVTGTSMEIDLYSALAEGVDINIGRSIQELEVSKYISILTGRFNLVWAFDKKANCVVVEPMWDTLLDETGESIRGFYRSYAYADDWTPYLQKFSGAGEFAIDEIQRFLEFAYCADSKDENIPDGYLNCTLDMGNKFRSGETTPVELDIAAAIDLLFPIEVQGGTNPTPVVPTVLDYAYGSNVVIEDNPPDDKKTCSSKMRTLYKVGIRDGTWAIDDGEGNAIIQEEFVKITMFDREELVNMGWCDESGMRGAISKFYATNVELYKTGSRHTMTFVIPHDKLENVVELFRRPKFVRTPEAGANYYILEEIPQAILGDQVVLIAKLITIN